MEVAAIVLNRIILMLIIIVCGMICYKTKLITIKGNKELSNLLLMVVNPLVIMMSYQQEFNATLVKNLLLSFLLSAVTYVFMIPLTNFFIRKRCPEYRIERFAVIYQNCGFFGIPLISAIYGSEGVFYLSAYMTVFNLFVWTHGVLLMGASDGTKLAPKQVVLSILNPTTIAALLGVLMFAFQITLPSQLGDALDMLGAMNTPLAMIIAGVTLAQTNLVNLFYKKRIYFCALLRLILMPVLTILLLLLVPLDPMLETICVLVTGCPTATTITMFSLRYERNPVYAAEIFAFTTVCCAVTLPLMMTLQQLVS